MRPFSYSLLPSTVMPTVRILERLPHCTTIARLPGGEKVTLRKPWMMRTWPWHCIPNGPRPCTDVAFFCSSVAVMRKLSLSSRWCNVLTPHLMMTCKTGWGVPTIGWQSRSTLRISTSAPEYMLVVFFFHLLFFVAFTACNGIWAVLAC